MHKKKIPKFQNPFDTIKASEQFLLGNINKGIQEGLDARAKNWYGDLLKQEQTSNLVGMVGNAALGVADSTFAAAGRRAETSSTGEDLFSSLSSSAFQMALQTGNPWAIAGAGVVKGLDYLNQYAGSKSQKQGTLGIQTGPYDALYNPMADKKFTALQSWFGGKHKKADELTQAQDHRNLVASNIAYQGQQAIKSSGVDAQYIAARNQQQLGGYNPSSYMVAKKGGSINPAQLRGLVIKAKKGVVIDKDPKFVQRLKNNDPNYTTLEDGTIGTHLISIMEADNNFYVFPKIQYNDDKKLTLYEDKEAFDRAMENNNVLKFKNLEEATKWTSTYKENYPEFFKQFEKVGKLKEGGKVNVIPDGALHGRLHNLPEDIAGHVTRKGIPVVSVEEPTDFEGESLAKGGEITQHAEVEKEEIIFNLDTTKILEEYFKKYKEAKSTEEKNENALYIGKLLVKELTENTVDNVGLLGNIFKLQEGGKVMKNKDDDKKSEDKVEKRMEAEMEEETKEKEVDEEEDKVEKNFLGYCIVKFLWVRDQAHLFHWQTKSNHIHEILDEFYTDYLEELDKLVESLLGLEKDPTFSLVNEKLLFVDYSEENLQEFINKTEKIFTEEFSEYYPQNDVKNLGLYHIVGDILELVYKLRYLSKQE